MSAEKKRSRCSGSVLYVGHIPHGFYEHEMKRFFTQFGRVIQVRLVRSRRTGRSRGFAFVHFAETAVARIAAETMDGYLMFGKRLVVRPVSPEKTLHPFRLGTKRREALAPPRQLERERFLRRQRGANRLRQDEKRRVRAQRRLASAGVCYSVEDIWFNTGASDQSEAKAESHAVS